MLKGQGPVVGGMVTEQDIAQALDSLFREANPNFTSYTSLHDVVQQLEAKLGFDVSHKIDFIRSQIQYLLRPPPPPQLLHHPQPLHKDHFALQQHPIFHPSPSNFAPSSQDLSFRPHQLQFETTSYAPSQPPPAPAPAPQPSKKSTQKVKRKRGGPGGLNKLCGVSPLLQPIVGHPTLPRTEISEEPAAMSSRVMECEGILLGMGNPLLDISAVVDNDFLTKTPSME